MRPVFVCLCCGVLLSLTEDIQAQSRTWTDHSGKTLRAKFVRLTKGRVTLELGGRRQSVPFWSLSTEDQEYVRQHPTVRGKLRDVPEVAEAPRGWTDVRGKSVTAQFIKVVDQKVVLAVKDKTSEIPFVNLSEADQDYVRDLLAKKGQEDLVPPKANKPGDQDTETPLNTGMPDDTVPNPPATSLPPRSSVHAPSIPETPSHTVLVQQPTRSIPAPNPSPPPRPSRQVASVLDRSPSINEPPPPTYPPVSEPESPPSEPPGGNTNSSPASATPGEGAAFFCSGRNKEVPASAKDKCPHCGQHWDYVENPDGTRTETAHGRRISFRAIRGIIILVMFVAGGIWRFVTRQ